MACSRWSASGCLRSHYPTGSSAVINDKRPEYWFVNLQSGAIRCSVQNDRNLPLEGGLSQGILAAMCVWLQVCICSWILVPFFFKAFAKRWWWWLWWEQGRVAQQLQLWPRGVRRYPIRRLADAELEVGGWRGGCCERREGSAAHSFRSSVRILDETGGWWWWRGHWASHSHTPPHRHRRCCCRFHPHPIASVPHCRVIRTVTL